MRETYPDIEPFHLDAEFVAGLFDRGAAFLIIGGWAAYVHGVRERDEIGDLDLLFSPDPSSMAILKSSLGNSEPVEKMMRPRLQMRPGGAYSIDILTPDEDVSFADLAARSVAAALLYRPVRIIGRDDLIAMKRQAIDRDKIDPEKHIRDLARLLA